MKKSKKRLYTHTHLFLPQGVVNKELGREYLRFEKNNQRPESNE
jgi:hypothetical protein